MTAPRLVTVTFRPTTPMQRAIVIGACMRIHHTPRVELDGTVVVQWWQP